MKGSCVMAIASPEADVNTIAAIPTAGGPARRPATFLRR